MSHQAPHAVARLRATRLALSGKPFLARGGPKGERCAGCRLIPNNCLCSLRPLMATRAGVCLMMGGLEAFKPSNTGWLIADMVADTFAFGWARTTPEPALLALLADPQWQPYVVFPGEWVATERMVTTVINEVPSVASGDMASGASPVAVQVGAAGKRPLFVLLDATWPEARKMFRKSPYLDRLPVLSLQPGKISRYRLRRSRRDDHFYTAEVAAMCLDLAGEAHAAQTLEAYLDVFMHHYLRAKQQKPADPQDPALLRLANLRLANAA